MGGDFYEALIVPGGMLLAHIGDIQGHSLHAATVMGELRHALRAFAIEEGHAPPGHQRPAQSGAASAITGRGRHPVPGPARPGLTGELQNRQLRAHPAAARRIRRTGTYRGQGGLLLGLPMHDPHAERAVLAPGGTILLLTDGLVEERQFFDVNMERLRAGHPRHLREADVDTFADDILSMFGPREDDVALIALRRA